VPRQHPFALRYTEHVPATDWDRSEEVLNRADMVENLKRPRSKRSDGWLTAERVSNSLGYAIRRRLHWIRREMRITRRRRHLVCPSSLPLIGRP
jgi:hypothetical protein